MGIVKVKKIELLPNRFKILAAILLIPVGIIAWVLFMIFDVDIRVED